MCWTVMFLRIKFRGLQNENLFHYHITLKVFCFLSCPHTRCYVSARTEHSSLQCHCTLQGPQFCILGLVGDISGGDPWLCPTYLGHVFTVQIFPLQNDSLGAVIYRKLQLYFVPSKFLLHLILLVVNIPIPSL